MTESGPSPGAAGDPSLTVEEARRRLLAPLQPITGVERVPVAAALGRVLAADLASPIDVPPHDNSAMDGYAFDGAALREGEALTLEIAGTALAGVPFAGPVGPGQAVRIMTGAVMPAGLDTVAPQELVEALGDGRVTIAAGAVRRGDHRRRRGEDLAQGRAALAAGRVLRPADCGLAASLGVRELAVRARLRVALFSTGDELRAPGEPLAPGQVYDSNRFGLRAALQRLGCEVIDLGLVRDDPAALQAAFEQAVEQADAVLTSGGVSVGEADHTRALLARMGEVAFWKIAMRPGRPFAFGALHHGGRRRWLFALPGNPVAAMVDFYALVRDALVVLAGARPEPPLRWQVRSATPIRKRPGRTEFQRGIVTRGADGTPEVRLTGDQGAGILRSLSEANVLVVLAHDRGPVAAGEPVEVWPFDGLV